MTTFQKINDKQYHSDRKNYLTSSSLRDFAKSAKLFKMKLDDELPDYSSTAQIFGNAFHCHMLEPADWQNRYVSDETKPINEKTGKAYTPTSKPYVEWRTNIALSGKELIKEKDIRLIERMSYRMNAHEEASKYISDLFALREISVRGQLNGVPCQCKIDIYSDIFGISDIKTTSNIDDFAKFKVFKYGYIHQLAFYRMILRRKNEQLNFNCQLIVIEKSAPNRVGVFKIDEGSLQRAEKENYELIERLKKCRTSDEWLDGYEELITIQLPEENTTEKTIEIITVERNPFATPIAGDIFSNENEDKVRVLKDTGKTIQYLRGDSGKKRYSRKDIFISFINNTFHKFIYRKTV